MSIHKLTAGDGYSYLTRQVAALDATERGHTGLSDYYSQRGESPGQWLGSALGDVDLQDGQEVTAAHMGALFGEGKHPNADAIAHAAAVQDALSWLERDAVLTRGGRNGVQQLDTTGMLAAAFDHRDSRAGDPDLHTHVAVSSKVRVRTADGTPGRWLSLDGRVLFKATVSASERYNTRVEAELHRRLGLSFTPRSDAA